ncbi:IS701 family transposase, partial [Streptomyces sp. NPDC057908]
LPHAPRDTPALPTRPDPRGVTRTCPRSRGSFKQALGLAHFEGRTWTGWHHHVTLVSVAHAFCTLQRLARAPKETAPA